MEKSVPSSAHLRTLREACGLTVETAADLCGVAVRTWQHWESPASKARIKPDVHELLAGLLDQKRADLAAILRGAEAQERVTLYRYLTDDDLHRDHPSYPHPAGLWNATVSAAVERLGGHALVNWAEPTKGSHPALTARQP